MSKAWHAASRSTSTVPRCAACPPHSWRGTAATPRGSVKPAPRYAKPVAMNAIGTITGTVRPAPALVTLARKLVGRWRWHDQITLRKTCRTNYCFKLLEDPHAARAASEAGRRQTDKVSATRPRSFTWARLRRRAQPRVEAGSARPRRPESCQPRIRTANTRLPGSASDGHCPRARQKSDGKPVS